MSEQPPDPTKEGMWAYWRWHEKREEDLRTDEEVKILSAMYAQYKKLRNIGWRSIEYCPKDGSRFLAVEPGTTGVYPCHYKGEWPDGTWWMEHSGDMWPARPMLWKPMNENS